MLATHEERALLEDLSAARVPALGQFLYQSTKGPGIIDHGFGRTKGIRCSGKEPDRDAVHGLSCSSARRVNCSW